MKSQVMLAELTRWIPNLVGFALMRTGSHGSQILVCEMQEDQQQQILNMYRSTLPFEFQGKSGEVVLNLKAPWEPSPTDLDQLKGFLGPFLLGLPEVQLQALEWVNSVFNKLKMNQRDWVGIYWKECFIDPEKSQSTDLVVGPYFGPWTPHTRISLESGLCGLAVRENRTVNVDDVRTDSRFLACSTSTRSEIVIPIRNTRGQVVGELDIDSNEVGAFDKATEAKLHAAVEQFGASLYL